MPLVQIQKRLLTWADLWYIFHFPAFLCKFWQHTVSKVNAFHIPLHNCMHLRTCIAPHTFSVHIHAYIHTYMNAHTYMHIHTHIHTYIRTYIRTYAHTHVHTYINTYIHVHAHIHTHIYSYIHVHTHVRIYTAIYTHIHSNTNKQNYSFSRDGTIYLQWHCLFAGDT